MVSPSKLRRRTSTALRRCSTPAICKKTKRRPSVVTSTTKIVLSASTKPAAAEVTSATDIVLRRPTASRRPLFTTPKGAPNAACRASRLFKKEGKKEGEKGAPNVLACGTTRMRGNVEKKEEDKEKSAPGTISPVRALPAEAKTTAAEGESNKATVRATRTIEDVEKEEEDKEKGALRTTCPIRAKGEANKPTVRATRTFDEEDKKEEEKKAAPRAVPAQMRADHVEKATPSDMRARAGIRADPVEKKPAAGAAAAAEDDVAEEGYEVTVNLGMLRDIVQQNFVYSDKRNVKIRVLKGNFVKLE